MRLVPGDYSRLGVEGLRLPRLLQEFKAFYRRAIGDLSRVNGNENGNYYSRLGIYRFSMEGLGRDCTGPFKGHVTNKV